MLWAFVLVAKLLSCRINMKKTFLLDNDVVKKYRHELKKKNFKVINGYDLYILDEFGHPVMDINRWDGHSSPESYLDALEDMSQNGQWLIVCDEETNLVEIYDLKDVDDYILFENTYA